MHGLETAIWRCRHDIDHIGTRSWERLVGPYSDDGEDDKEDDRKTETCLGCFRGSFPPSVAQGSAGRYSVRYGWDNTHTHAKHPVTGYLRKLQSFLSRGRKEYKGNFVLYDGPLPYKAAMRKPESPGLAHRTNSI